MTNLLTNLLTTLVPGQLVRVSLEGRKAFTGVVVSASETMLCLDDPQAPGARYGMTGFSWARVFLTKSKGWIASVCDVPHYQAPATSVEVVPSEGERAQMEEAWEARTRGSNR